MRFLSKLVFDCLFSFVSLSLSRARSLFISVLILSEAGGNADESPPNATLLSEMNVTRMYMKNYVSFTISMLVTTPSRETPPK